jgi:hypothetical protein
MVGSEGLLASCRTIGVVGLDEKRPSSILVLAGVVGLDE